MPAPIVTQTNQRPGLQRNWRAGFEVLSRLRANPDWKDIKVLVLSAKGQDFDRDRASQFEVAEYITKPFSTRDILDCARQHLAA